MAELGAVSCNAGGAPIVGAVRWVDSDDGPPVPMCPAHAQADECGQELVDLFDGDPKAIAVLDGLMRIPCPDTPSGDVVLATGPIVEDAESRLLLDRLAPYRTGG